MTNLSYKRLYNYSTTLMALFKEDFTVFKKLYIDKLIDCAIVAASNIIIMGSIMQAFGLSADFGPIMVGSLITSAMLFQAYGAVGAMVADISGPKTISHYLIMPIPSALVFIKIIGTWALQGFLISIIIVPLSKLLLWNRLDLTLVSWVKLLIMSSTVSIFYGAFALWITSAIKHMGMMGSVWTRFIFPLWIFGGFQFSWYALAQVFPHLAYFGLLNPLLYTTEGLRDALLGGPYISAWICAPVLIIATVILTWFSIRTLRKRLDFV